MATRYVAPGRLPWIGTGEADLQSLVEKYQLLGRCCQIVGPHGSGKSTLLEHLVPRIGSKIVRIDVDGENNGPSPSESEQLVWWFTLRRGSGAMNRFDEIWTQNDFRGILVLDGAEQLSWWRRRRLCHWAHRRMCGLLVTSHNDLGLCTLLETKVTPHLAREVVCQAFSFARGQTDLPPIIDEIDWESRLRHHQGNLRECLMDLYDQMENVMREAK